MAAEEHKDEIVSLPPSVKSQRTVESVSAYKPQTADDGGTRGTSRGLEESNTPELYDLRTAYKDLVIAPQVTYEDVVSVHGQVSSV